ncbi:MAG TPA: hypothetical protein VGD67_11415 [Pseudonocardiaceae bacterium]
MNGRPATIETHESWLPMDHPLHRPRHGGRQRPALVCAVVFFLAPLLAFVLGVRPGEIENRPLARLGGSGGFWGALTGLPVWASDHLPLRGVAVDAQDAISRGVFGEPPPIGQGRQGTPLGPIGPVPDGAQGGPVDVSTFPSVVEGPDGWLFFGQDITLKCAPKRPLDETITALRRLRSAVESSGREFVLVVAPDKSTMMPEYLPASYPGKDCSTAAASEFWRRLPAETGAVDVRPPLRDAAQRRGPIYDRVDSHWTYEGGVVMTYAIANELSPGLSSGWKVAPTPPRPWPADLPPLLGRTAERMLQAYSLAPDGGIDRTNFEPSDFRAPQRFTTTPVPGAIDGTTVMIADSFTQFASPYLAAVFTDLTIVHPETVGAEPDRYADLLATSDSVVVEIAERHLAGGATPILDPAVVDRLSRALAAKPRR